jgi:DNA-binding MarR family transcriptional regulator
MRVLMLAEREPGIQPGALAAHILEEVHSVSGLLNRLEDADLIERRRFLGDRRIVLVYPTPRGLIVAERAAAIFGHVSHLVAAEMRNYQGGRNEALARIGAAARKERQS